MVLHVHVVQHRRDLAHEAHVHKRLVGDALGAPLALQLPECGRQAAILLGVEGGGPRGREGEQGASLVASLLVRLSLPDP